MRGRDRRALILGATILGPIALGFLGIRPYAQSLEQLQEEIALESGVLAKEVALTASEADAGPSAELVSSLSGHAARMFLMSGLRTSDETVDPLAYARLLAVASGMDVQSAELEIGEGPTPDIITVDILIVATTDVTGLQRLVDGMTAGPKFLRMKDLTVSRLEEARGDGTEPLSVRLVVGTYATADEPRSPTSAGAS